jgi:hypothetical protein
MFDASLERLSMTETGYINSLAERAPRSTIQTLPATLNRPVFAGGSKASKDGAYGKK